jgi:hypothetical protein
MIQTWVERFDSERQALQKQYLTNPPQCYADIVKDVIGICAKGKSTYEFPNPDADRITVIDHGDYQGTQLFIIAEQGYQPSHYYAVCVNYGSCSHCDTFCGIADWNDGENPELSRAKQYVDLALHIFQSITKIS